MNEQVFLIEECWPAFLEIRRDFASELRKIAEEIPNSKRRQVNSIVAWLEGSPTSEAALANPDALAVCIPMLRVVQKGDHSQSDVGRAARLGFCSLGRNVSSGSRLFALLVYPFLVMLAALTLWVAFSFWVLPQFEQMYAEFGIELPAITLLVIKSSSLVRKCWWLIILLLAVLGVVIYLATIGGGGIGKLGPSWLDQRLMSTRNALASWAWHLSLLLETGVSTSEAFRVAGSATGNHRLRASSLGWAKNASIEDKTKDNGDPASRHSFFVSPDYQLLNRTLLLESKPGKIVMLRETAIYYWDRCRNVGDWWVYWLVACILWAVGAMVLVGVVALFMPMIQLVSGLTS